MVRRHPARRSGVAAVEMAVITSLVLCPLMLAVWEVGRMVYVKQIVSNAAREGARLAGQSITINADGTRVQIGTNSGTSSVADTAYRFVTSAGLKTLARSDVLVTFEYLSADGSTVTGMSSNDPNAGSSGSKNQPYQGAKGDRFRVTVTVPWDKVRWSPIGVLFQPGTTAVTHSVNWEILVDDPFAVNTTLPTW